MKKSIICCDEFGKRWKLYPSGRKNELRLINCYTCQKECLVEIRKIRAGGNNGKFCSVSCAQKAIVGPKRHQWRGGRSIDKDGYVRIAINGKKWLEHRLVMENMIGRKLEKYENVHHRNGVKTDNRPENLELWIRPQPTGVRLADAIKHCPTCTCCKEKK